MADLDLSGTAVSGRSIAATDLAVGFRGTAAAAEAPRTDPWATVITTLASQIASAYENLSDRNQFTDALKTKLDGLTAGSGAVETTFSGYTYKEDTSTDAGTIYKASDNTTLTIVYATGEKADIDAAVVAGRIVRFVFDGGYGEIYLSVIVDSVAATATEIVITPSDQVVSVRPTGFSDDAGGTLSVLRGRMPSLQELLDTPNALGSNGQFLGVQAGGTLGFSTPPSSTTTVSRRASFTGFEVSDVSNPTEAGHVAFYTSGHQVGVRIAYDGNKAELDAAALAGRVIRFIHDSDTIRTAVIAFATATAALLTLTFTHDYSFAGTMEAGTTFTIEIEDTRLQRFVDLLDTPRDLGNINTTGGKRLAVNSVADAIEFVHGDTLPVIERSPSLDDVGAVVNTGTDLRRVARRNSTPPTIVWQAYSLLADVSALWGESTGTYRWRGRHPGGSSISNPAVGDVICTVGGYFEAYRSGMSGTGWWHLAQPDGFLGVFLEGTSEANVQVSAVGQTAQYGDGLHSVTSYTAGTEARAVLHRAIPQVSILDLSDTPASLGTAGQRLAVNSGATALEFVDATAEQTSGGGSGWTTEEPVTARNELAGNSLNEPFSNTQIQWNDFSIASIAKTALREIEVVISIQDRFDYYGRWGPAAIRRVGAYPGGYRDDDVTTWPWTNNNQRIPCFYLSGENDTGSDKRDPPLMLPSFFQANSRRLQEIESFFIFLIQGGVSDENLVGVRIYYNGDINCYLERLAITYASS